MDVGSGWKGTRSAGNVYIQIQVNFENDIRAVKSDGFTKQHTLANHTSHK